jgi:ribosome biogenesis GTPase / thiamine phosphate phosphatase
MAGHVSNQAKAPTTTPPAGQGRVIASHGRQVLVEAADGRRIPCAVQGRRLQVVCGDDVMWRADAMQGKGIVIERLPRRSALSRTNSSGAAETLVANISQVVALCAAQPVPDFFIVDRYVAAAELLGIRAAIVRNKKELSGPGDTATAELAVYARIGYTTLECSARTGEGLADLEALLRDEVSVLVGQSGVGKSSLANRLLPGLGAVTAELSSATDEGRHATSVATLHHLPQGGDLLDSPGVRDFAPAIELIGDPAQAFREIAALAPNCRFTDCRHLREPGCAVRGAVQEGGVSARRYESYRRLGRLREELAPPPGRSKAQRHR